MEQYQDQATNRPPSPGLDAQDEKPPRLQRRSREVSSRYMMTPSSPAPSISSDHRTASSPNFPHLPPPPPKKHHRPPSPATSATAESGIPMWTPSVQRYRPAVPSSPDATDSESESSCFGDENRPEEVLVFRGVETPMASGLRSRPVGSRRRKVERLFRENVGVQQQPAFDHSKLSDQHLKQMELKFVPRTPRPGTPVGFLVDRKRSAATPRPTIPRQNVGRVMGSRISSKRTATQVDGSPREAASSRLSTQERVDRFSAGGECDNGPVDISPENSNLADFSESETDSVCSQGGLCDSPPIQAQGSRVWQVSDCRSSMPEANLLPTMSGRLLKDGSSGCGNAINYSSLRDTSSACCRSLNLALSNCEPHPFNSTKSICKSSASSRTHTSCGKAGAASSLPHSTNPKLGLDSRKREDLHNLRLLENCYLQWRFANAKAQAAMHAQKIAAEKSIYSLMVQISELRNSVVTRRIELQHLKRIQRSSTILEAQMPYLEEWTNLEADYSSCLCGTTKALQDASLRLPISGEVRANIAELSEAIDFATNVLYAIYTRVGIFLPKGEVIDNNISNLARIVSIERTLIEEGADLLFEAQRLQVKECSLRGHLVQLKRSSVESKTD